MIETVWTPRPAFVGVRDTREPQTRAKRVSLGVTVTSDPNRACTIETESSPGAPLVSPNPGCFLCLPLPVSLSPFYHPVRCLGFFFFFRQDKMKWHMNSFAQMSCHQTTKLITMDRKKNVLD